MPKIQYIIVRKDILKRYGFGFMAAQIGHATIAPISNQLKRDITKPTNQLLDQDTLEWIQNTFFKCVLEIPDLEQLQNLIQVLSTDNIQFFPIVESRINELTCIGVKPYDKKQIAPYFKSLKLLK